MWDQLLLGLVEMTSGLVNVGFSLPEWQAVKMIFFAPWTGTAATFTTQCSEIFQFQDPQIWFWKQIKLQKYDSWAQDCAADILIRHIQMLCVPS